MGMRRTQLLRKGLILCGIILVMAWVAPLFFSAERYRHRLETGLEQVLRRPVTFGAVSLRLIPHPGFSIWNAVIREDPAFGSEPFARVDRIDCDLRWHSLWRSRLSFSRLYLENPAVNAVRVSQGEWNLENLLMKSGFTSAQSLSGHSRPIESFDLDAEGARINFKVGEDKKPFAITDLKARLTIDPTDGLVRFDLTGKPIRTDISLPTPGETLLRGEWRAGPDLRGPLSATLTSRGSMLYDWVPLVSGRNPGVYGVVDATVQLSGCLQNIEVEGTGSVSDLHHWELQPPSSSTPLDFQVRGSYDRLAGRATMKTLDLGFGDSHLTVAGNISRISHNPDLDLAIDLRQARIEDALALGGRFASSLKQVSVSGRLDGHVAVNGPAAGPRSCQGLVTGHNLRFRLPQVSVPVADVSLHIDNRGARLSPVRIALSPRLEVLAQGGIDFSPPSTVARIRDRSGSRPHRAHGSNFSLASDRRIRSARSHRAIPAIGEPAASPVSSPRYDLTLSANALPLAELVRFARNNGVSRLRGIEAQQGSWGGSLHFAGNAWPLMAPHLAAKLDLSNGLVVLPGLSKPLAIGYAAVSLDGGRVVADPISAAIGKNSFNAWLEHEGDRGQPWNFGIETDQLPLEQAALWFEALGSDSPASLLDRLPGFGSFAIRRSAASNLFAALNAQGEFSAGELTYRSLALKDFAAQVDISSRTVKVTGARFGFQGGRGQGSLVADLSAKPPRLTGSIAVEEASLRTLTHNLKGPLRDSRGNLTASVNFSTQGLSRPEVASTMAGQGWIRLKNVSVGDFEFLGDLARELRAGPLEHSRRGGAVGDAQATFDIRDSKVVTVFAPLEISGAILSMQGTYGFDGDLDVAVRADLSRLTRRWQGEPFVSSEDPQVEEAAHRQWETRFTGNFEKLKLVPQNETAHSVGN